MLVLDAEEQRTRPKPVIPKFITSMLKGGAPTIFGDGTQSRDSRFVTNVVAANLSATHVEQLLTHLGSRFNESPSRKLFPSLGLRISARARHLANQFLVHRGRHR